MKSEQIAELQKLEAAATPAPWRPSLPGVHGDVRAFVPPENAFQRERVATLGIGGWPVTVIGSGDMPADEAISAEDAALVVVMRNCIKQLLDEREALLKALRPIVERLDGDREFINPDGGAEMLVAARAAIAKAEAP